MRKENYRSCGALNNFHHIDSPGAVLDKLDKEAIDPFF